MNTTPPDQLDRDAQVSADPTQPTQRPTAEPHAPASVSDMEGLYTLQKLMRGLGNALGSGLGSETGNATQTTDTKSETVPIHTILQQLQTLMMTPYPFGDVKAMQERSWQGVRLLMQLSQALGHPALGGQVWSQYLARRWGDAEAVPTETPRDATHAQTLQTEQSLDDVISWWYNWASMAWPMLGHGVQGDDAARGNDTPSTPSTPSTLEPTAPPPATHDGTGSDGTGTYGSGGYGTGTVGTDRKAPPSAKDSKAPLSAKGSKKPRSNTRRS